MGANATKDWLAGASSVDANCCCSSRQDAAGGGGSVIKIAHEAAGDRRSQAVAFQPAARWVREESACNKPQERAVLSLERAVHSLEPRQRRSHSPIRGGPASRSPSPTARRQGVHKHPVDLS
jgi:hypothetical protein